MSTSFRLRFGAAATPAALALAFGLVLAGGSGGDAAAAPGTKATRYLLRLTDLPPGYVVLPIGAIGREGQGPSGPNRPCGRLAPADPEPQLAGFIARRHPAGCFAAYVRLYRVPGSGPHPLLAGSGALDGGSPEGAREALALAPQILSHFHSVDALAAARPTATRIGEESLLIPWEGAQILGDDEAGAYVIWRSGRVVGAVLATGRSQAAAERDALALAQLQQPHVERPTPYRAAEADDSEVALDNPALRRPVYWLGPSFAPGAGLPPLRLERSMAQPGGPPDGARQSASLSYRQAGARGRWTQVELQVHTRERWRAMRRGSAGSVPARHCARVREVELRRGRALLYATHERTGRTCPRRAPDVFLAHAFLGRAVVTVGLLEVCATCAGPGSGPYDSFRGVATIVRALRPRAKTAF